MNRHDNGVKVRNDGKGDAWANAHRNLPRNFYMQDVDACFGFVAFGHNTGEKLFIEYTINDTPGAIKTATLFSIVAMFDRKKTRIAAEHAGNRISLQFYLWQCRTFAEHQPEPPRFFFVIGDQEPPWQMLEVNIHTAEVAEDGPVIYSADGQEWRKIWNDLGLSNLRTALDMRNPS